MSLYQDVLKLFATSVLGSRVRPEQLVIMSCRDVLKKVTHSLFKECLYPALCKALLRNPDELMSSKSLCVCACVCKRERECFFMQARGEGETSHP